MIDNSRLGLMLETLGSWEAVSQQIGISADAARKRWSRYRRSAHDNQVALMEHLDEEAIADLVGMEDDEFPLEEALDIADRLSTLMDLVDPIITSVELRFPARPIGIMFTSCAHLGGRYTFYQGVREAFARLKETDGLYMLSLGDEIEGFPANFRDASAVTDQVLPLKLQYRIYQEYLRQWSEEGKILAGCSSQHGIQWFEQRVGLNPIKGEYRATKTPYFEGKGVIKAHVGDQLYIIVCGHKFPGTSIYNKNHAQRRLTLFDYPSADIAVMGDKHNYSVQHMADRVDEYMNGLRESPYVWHVQVGTAKIGSDPYTIRGWQHGWFEWPILVLFPEEHQIVQAYRMKDLEWMLRDE